MGRRMNWQYMYGGNYVYYDENGRIVGEYQVSQFDGTVRAYYEKNELGRYMTEDYAKKAIEEAHKNQILK